MHREAGNRYRRPGTWFSKDGCTAFVRLRVTRRSYEFARAWAAFHAAADPDGTAEDHLEGFLETVLASRVKGQRKEPHAVIIDDISRPARGLMAHFELRVKIGDAGGVLVSPSVEFGEDSDSQLVENLLASVSQHQRQKNGEQTVNRMRARMQNGY